MSRIDHANEARARLIQADSDVSENFPATTGEHKADIIAAAQVHALLAIHEQLRVGNLVALASNDASRLGLGHAVHEKLSNARSARFGEVIGLAPDIAAVLGIGGESS